MRAAEVLALDVAEFAILPPQNASGNWVKVVQRLPVKLRLTERPGEPPLRAGMTAYVSIDTRRSRSVSKTLAKIFGSGDAAARALLDDAVAVLAARGIEVDS